jgi:CheY-like chemotaxis protein
VQRAERRIHRLSAKERCGKAIIQSGAAILNTGRSKVTGTKKSVVHYWSMTTRLQTSGSTKAAGEKGSVTIMVVEPEILIRMVIADYLRNCGYKVIEGVSAEDVYVILRAGGAINIILSSVSLSGDTDGFTLARHIRQHHSNIDIILTSDAVNAANKASQLCDDGPLEKPYHPDEVIRRINLLRERRRNEQQRRRKPTGNELGSQSP